MTAGAQITGPQTQNDAAAYASRLVSFLKDFESWAQRINDVGAPALAAAYATLYAQDGTEAAAGQADATDLMTFVQDIETILMFTSYQAPENSETVTDNTTSNTPATVVVPPGAYCVFTTDPTSIMLHRSVGTDLSPQIRKLAPLNN